MPNNHNLSSLSRESCGSKVFRATIPHLRRFGRAISGSQMEADTAVLQVMSTYAGDPITIGSASRIGLYRQLVGALNKSCSGDYKCGDISIPTPTSRQAHLLVNVEGFTDQEVSQVIPINSPDVAAQLAAVERENLSLAPAKILIIEDDPAVASELEYIVRDLGHNVSGFAATHGEAVQQIHKCQPNLILSDLQLADGSSGLNAVNEILTFAPLPVIFITAHPALFLTGTRREPLFALAKPFKIDSVRATVGQALFLFKQCAISGEC